MDTTQQVAPFTGDWITDMFTFLKDVFWNYEFLIMLLAVILLMEAIKLLVWNNDKVDYDGSTLGKRITSAILCVLMLFLTGAFKNEFSWELNVFKGLLNWAGLFVVYQTIFKKWIDKFKEKFGIKIEKKVDF